MSYLTIIDWEYNFFCNPSFMDLHQKISIGIFGALLLGTLAMYSTGSLSSSVINTDTVGGATDCTDAYMKSYATQYTTDQETLKELQQFVGRNCR